MRSDQHRGGSDLQLMGLQGKCQSFFVHSRPDNAHVNVMKSVILSEAPAWLGMCTTFFCPPLREGCCTKGTRYQVPPQPIQDTQKSHDRASLHLAYPPRQGVKAARLRYHRP